MLSWAVKLFLASVLVSPSDQDVTVQAAWKLASPSVVKLKQGLNPVGTAVMIDSAGYFLANKSVLGSIGLTGFGADGKAFSLNKVSLDEASGLVLLQAMLTRPAGINPARLTMSSLRAGANVIVVLADSIESGQVSNPDRLGVIAGSNRVLSLTEVKLEAPNPALAGAPVFTMQGELVGILNSNLGSSQRLTNSMQLAAQSNMLGGGGARDLANSKAMSNANYGPSPLTVAYSISPEILHRVVSGFLSPSHLVDHPFAGIFVHDSPTGGAYVDTVTPGSPAAAAGLQAGDVLFKFGSYPVQGQVSFARALLMQRVGDRVLVGYLRGDKAATAILIIGRSRN